MKTKYIFIRHAEAEKNIEDIVGGSGTCLTTRGTTQAQILLSKLTSFIDGNTIKLYSAPINQAIETALVISNYFGVEVEITEELAPSDMGVLTGLSIKEIQENYPKEYDVLCRWRNREIDVTDFNIPKMKEPKIFWNQMLDFLKSKQNGGTVIAVCTRSTMVFAFNLVAGNTPVLGGNYRHVDIDYCEYCAFEFSDNGEIKRIIEQ